jgi:hypothetical protein
MTNPNLILADAMLERAYFWADYGNSTFCPRRVAIATIYQERYFRAYHYLMRRANRR